MGRHRYYRRGDRTDCAALDFQLPGCESLQLAGGNAPAGDRADPGPSSCRAEGVQARAEIRAIHRRPPDNCGRLSGGPGRGEHSEYDCRDYLCNFEPATWRTRRDYGLSDFRISGSLHFDNIHSDYFFLGRRQLRESANAFSRTDYRAFAGSLATNDSADGRV